MMHLYMNNHETHTSENDFSKIFFERASLPSQLITDTFCFSQDKVCVAVAEKE